MTNEATEVEDFLAHYGVAGMQWGVRKDINDGDSERIKQRKKIHNATLKKLNGPNADKDERSDKTKRLGKARTATFIAAMGGAVLTILDPEPISKGILAAATILAVGGDITLSALEEKSAEKDLLKKYGD